VRDGDRAPFVLHPLEVASLLAIAGYTDHVVAAAVLHDVLEDTDTDRDELETRFGLDVSALVSAVTEDPSIPDEGPRKAALRSQVASGPGEAAAVFAADKVSKARETRLKLSCGMGEAEGVDEKLRHYEESLAMLEPALGADHAIVAQLRFELEALALLPPA
jgi:hypothetical protein